MIEPLGIGSPPPSTAPAAPLASGTTDLEPNPAQATAPVEPTLSPLDLAGVLRILNAEIELALFATGLGEPAWPTVDAAPLAASTSGAETLAALLVTRLLDRMPGLDEPNAVWNAMPERVIAAFAAGSESALTRIAAWRDVPRDLVDYVGLARTSALAAFEADPVEAALRAAWVSVETRLARYRRRRRLAFLDLDPLDAELGEHERAAREGRP